MNRESSNALLKILEEPPQNRYLLLTSSHAGNLLPTIKSRVNEIAFPSPNITQTAQQMEKLLRQNEVVATEERIAKALQKHPYAPVLAYDYCLQKGDEVEQIIIQWLYDVWVLSKATIFPELPQLQAAIGDRVSLQQTKLKTIQLLISELILQRHQPPLDVAPSLEGSVNKMKQKILADMPNDSLLQVYQRLIQLTPQLQQINAQSKINAIIHQYKPI
jgi:DNA polymerase-3 subunit delta'